MPRKNVKPSPNWEDLGTQLRLWRTHVGLKQSVLEERAGLAHNAVSRIETGEVGPRLETLERLAGALGISVEELQFRVPPPRGRSEADDMKLDLLQRMEKLGKDDREKLLEIFHSVLDLLERNR